MLGALHTGEVQGSIPCAPTISISSLIPQMCPKRELGQAQIEASSDFGIDGELRQAIREISAGGTGGKTVAYRLLDRKSKAR
jgi:hypothetical protein